MRFSESIESTVYSPLSV